MAKEVDRDTFFHTCESVSYKRLKVLMIYVW